MRTNSFAAIIAVAIMMAVCVVPAMCDDYDGATTQRTSNYDIYEGKFWKEPNTYLGYIYNYYFKEDSDNHKAMKAYIADPLNNNVTSDDNDSTMGSYSGWVYVYVTRNYEGTNNVRVAYDYYCDLHKVLDAYGKLTFFVKAGQTVKMSIESISDEGEDAKPYIYPTTGQEYLSTNFEKHFTASFNMLVYFDNAKLYADSTYEISGISEPNGSATAYFVFCAIVTVLVLAILAYAALKPKWSK